MGFKLTLTYFAILGSSIAAFTQVQDAAKNGDNGKKSAIAVPIVLLRGTLGKELNSKSATVGQTFMVKTEEALRLTNGTEIPAGSDVSGHVIQATTRTDGASEALLTLTFDALQPKGSATALPIRGIIQAITGPAPASISAPAVGDMRTESIGGGASGARIPSDQVHGDLAVGDAGAELNERSAGVIGIKNLTLTAGPVNGVDATMFRSSEKAVKLQSGVRLILRIALKQ